MRLLHLALLFLPSVAFAQEAVREPAPAELAPAKPAPAIPAKFNGDGERYSAAAFPPDEAKLYLWRTLDEWATELQTGKTGADRSAAGTFFQHLCARRLDSATHLTAPETATVRQALLKVVEAGQSTHERSEAATYLRHFVDAKCREPLLKLAAVKTKPRTPEADLRVEILLALTPVADDTCLPLARTIVLERQPGANEAFRLIVQVATPAARRELETIAKNEVWRDAANRELEKLKTTK